MSNIIILAAIILYLGMVVWIGVICSKKNSDVGDFYLGGRKLGPVVTAMSAEAYEQLPAYGCSGTCISYRTC